MKTQNDKLRFIMEAVGEPWYNEKSYKSIYDDDGVRLATYFCDINPSPDDMSKLMELAEKLEVIVVMCSNITNGKWWYSVQILNIKCDPITEIDLDTPQEALLNALFVAKGGLEDE